ncbi:MAG: serine/threonine-protein kinase [Pseudomonadota bacterium]
MTTDLTSTVPLLPGQVLLHYRVLGLLAEGGMAEVYLARDLERPPTDQVVVLKRVRPHLLADPRFETMFVNEAQLASMIHHGSVVDVHELARTEGELLLAMEFLNGKTLLAVGKTCDTGGFWVPHTVLARIVADTAAGLHHAHILTDAQGQPLRLVHRDMSPENVIVCFDGRVKVVDFGVAKARMTPDTTQHGVVKGKLNYLAPEAIRGEALDARADLYALGVTLYLFLTAQFPYSVRSTDQLIEQMMRSEPRPPRSYNAQIPAGLEAICLRCLARDRDQRYRSADELRQALERFISDSGPAVTSRHVAAFMNQLYPKETDSLRVWVESLSGPQSLPAAAPLPPPAMAVAGHGGTLEMDAPEEASSSTMVTGFTPPTHWREVSNIHHRATNIVTNLQASGVHVALRHLDGSRLEGAQPTGERPLWQPGEDSSLAGATHPPRLDAPPGTLHGTRVRERRWPRIVAFLGGVLVVLAVGSLVLDVGPLPGLVSDADDADAGAPLPVDAGLPVDSGVPAGSGDAAPPAPEQLDASSRDQGVKKKKKKKKRRRRRRPKNRH